MHLNSSQGQAVIMSSWPPPNTHRPKFTFLGTRSNVHNKHNGLAAHLTSRNKNAGTLNQAHTSQCCSSCVPDVYVCVRDPVFHHITSWLLLPPTSHTRGPCSPLPSACVMCSLGGSSACLPWLPRGAEGWEPLGTRATNLRQRNKGPTPALKPMGTLDQPLTAANLGFFILK